MGNVLDAQYIPADFPWRVFMKYSRNDFLLEAGKVLLMKIYTACLAVLVMLSAALLAGCGPKATDTSTSGTPSATQPVASPEASTAALAAEAQRQQAMRQKMQAAQSAAGQSTQPK